MSNDYDEMREIQRVRQAEIAAWRTAQGLDEARELEVQSVNRVTNPEAIQVTPSLSEPIEEEDTDAQVSTPAVEVTPDYGVGIKSSAPKSRTTKPAKIERVGSDGKPPTSS